MPQETLYLPGNPAVSLDRYMAREYRVDLGVYGTKPSLDGTAVTGLTTTPILMVGLVLRAKLPRRSRYSLLEHRSPSGPSDLTPVKAVEQLEKVLLGCGVL
jgi:hypothetical protein